MMPHVVMALEIKGKENLLKDPPMNMHTLMNMYGRKVIFVPSILVPWLRVSIPVNLPRPNAQHRPQVHQLFLSAGLGPGLILISVSGLSQPAYLGKSH